MRKGLRNDFFRENIPTSPLFELVEVFLAQVIPKLFFKAYTTLWN